MQTWKEFLQHFPSQGPTLGDLSRASVRIAPYTAHDAPPAARFLRQSDPDQSPLDFPTRAIQALEEELIRRDLLDKPLPPLVLSVMSMLALHIENPIEVEADAVKVFYSWLDAAEDVLSALNILSTSQALKRLFSEQGDRDLLSFSDAVTQDASKGVSVEIKSPSVLAFHSRELTEAHQYSPMKIENGRAILAKLDLQTQFNPPAEVGIIMDGFCAVFVEYTTLDVQRNHRAVIVSKVYPVVSPPSPSPFSAYPAYSSARNIPFLPILVSLLLPETRIPTPTQPKLVNPIHADNPPNWSGKMQLQMTQARPDGTVKRSGDEKNAPRPNFCLIPNSHGCETYIVVQDSLIPMDCSSSSSPDSSIDSSLEGNANTLIQLGNHANTWKGVFGQHKPAVFKFTRGGSQLALSLFSVEVRAYNILSGVSPQVIPHFYGYFLHEGDPVLVLGDAGESLKGEFWIYAEPLMRNERLSIYQLLQTLHQHGIKFYPRNIIRRDCGGFYVIDFQEAELDHQFLPKATNATFSVELINGGENNQNDYGVEANMDTEHATGIAWPTPMIFYRPQFCAVLEILALDPTPVKPTTALTKLSSSPRSLLGHCSHVTSVGATTGIAPEIATTQFPSGGGFSNVFPQPSYQSTAIAAFLKKLGHSRQGWCYVGIPGPVAVRQPPSALNDVVTETNEGCGFGAGTGWDPATGLGTPNFVKLEAVV
ncbi:hypothetical protein BDP27DRAFT_1412856 [Rhodocollybia butyracea]|uniref:Uncharacterized protein n=1 Tax=Rhodocollybia butyracea TaxID=206335 RepID=A0A9P5Q3X0_9AGAR|nr:hypothetical protein BDP27DRAFT_1412856 [Rhodocollybia butyracea]